MFAVLYERLADWYVLLFKKGITSPENLVVVTNESIWKLRDLEWCEKNNIPESAFHKRFKLLSIIRKG